MFKCYYMSSFFVHTFWFSLHNKTFKFLSQRLKTSSWLWMVGGARSEKFFLGVQEKKSWETVHWRKSIPNPLQAIMKTMGKSSQRRKYLAKSTQNIQLTEWSVEWSFWMVVETSCSDPFSDFLSIFFADPGSETKLVQYRQYRKQSDTRTSCKTPPEKGCKNSCKSDNSECSTSWNS